MTRKFPHIPKPRPRPKEKTSRNTGRGGNVPIESAECKTAFLAVLSQPTGSVAKACRAIGIDRQTAYNWRKKDDQFRALWEDALEDGVDGLEEEARRRGFEGVRKPVTIAGEREEVIEYSDTLLGLVLKGRRNAVFGRDKVEHTGPEGGPIQHEVKIKFVSAGARK